MLRIPKKVRSVPPATNRASLRLGLTTVGVEVEVEVTAEERAVRPPPHFRGGSDFGSPIINRHVFSETRKNMA